ncbi:TPA: hypothetical protein ACH3X2_007038 [Trebouxia sp. C0005]|nr:MAG: hypothetical protein FRX49_01224 [Trebouxia sp. A1-2]
MTGNLQGVKLLNPKYFRLLGTTQAGLPEFVAANLDKLVTSENSSSVIQLLQQISSNIGQASGSSSIVSSLAASLAATSVDDTAGPDGKMPTALEDAEALLKAAIQAEYSGESIESQITAAIAIAVVDFGLKLSSSNCHYVLVPVPVKAVGAAIVHLKQRLSLGSKSLASIVFELHLERYFSISEGASSKQITVRPAALLPDATDAVRRLLPGVAWSESSSEVAAQAKRVTEAASCEPSSSSQQVYSLDTHSVFDVTKPFHVATMQSLETLLEDTTVVKILHDSRQPSAALLYQQGIALQSVFDT